ncbi:hypothetical protein E9549_01055 [Blastococcus sp. MG754426]|uniref:hypothetical protein n=1 Tax=unclassified Blastococcus TaxID=2619396 RepID=UPI001EF058EA|nr:MULTISPECIES: hypothetical protein [unclassified Blastococcus]MCF6506005.1 hypothetical protein [Blastococcus sp. MG754426]MCF6510609.1 hypothetical protein [Blastococcus sp. MG754427]MCF6736957.1 hypothetical protein [Blastococcus sp. KM273129]
MTEDRGAPAPPPRRLADRLFGASVAQPVARPAEPGKPTPQAPPSLRRAALVVAVEGLAFGVLTLVLLYLTLTGNAESVPRALAEVVLAALAAGVLLAAARGLWRVAAWARAPVVALQLFLGLTGFTFAFSAQQPLIGLPILALVAAVLYLLAAPDSRLAYEDS